MLFYKTSGDHIQCTAVHKMTWGLLICMVMFYCQTIPQQPFIFSPSTQPMGLQLNTWECISLLVQLLCFTRWYDTVAISVHSNEDISSA